MTLQTYWLFVTALSLLSLLAVFRVTPQARLFVDTWEAAARAVGLTPKQIAACQELDLSQWNRQFAGADGQHVSAYRLGRMAEEKPDVAREYLRRISPAFGMVAIDRRDTLVALIESNLDLVEVNRALLKSLGIDPNWRSQLRAYLLDGDRKETA